MPDLHDFDDFTQGLPTMDFPPPSEIRRRGDRLRRRRTALAATGGVLAAVIAISAPVIALSGGDDTDSRPGYVEEPTSSPTHALTAEPDAGWVTTIPDGFPLTDGFADEDAQPETRAWRDLTVPSECIASPFALRSENVTDNQVVTYTGENSEDRAERYLVVYEDEATARAYFSQWWGLVDLCDDEQQDGGVTRTHDVVSNIDLPGTEESHAFVDRVVLDDGLMTDLSLMVAGRTGNAVYVEVSQGAVASDDQVEAEIARLRENATPVTEALCVFAFDGCTDD